MNEWLSSLSLSLLYALSLLIHLKKREAFRDTSLVISQDDWGSPHIIMQRD